MTPYELSGLARITSVDAPYVRRTPASMDWRHIDAAQFSSLIKWRQADVGEIPTARRMEPPPAYRLLWDDLCKHVTRAGLTPRHASFDELRWYACDSIPTALVRRMQSPHGTPSDTKMLLAGMYLQDEHAIALRVDMLSRIDVVRHHMTHAMHGDAESDPTWFDAQFHNTWEAGTTDG